MAKRGSGKAVGYIRAGSWKGKLSPDVEVQREIFMDYAKRHKYDLLEIRTEVQRFDKRYKKLNNILEETIALCKSENANFLYFNVGMARNNPDLTTAVFLHSRSEKWQFIKITDHPLVNELSRIIRRFNKYILLDMNQTKPKQSKSKKHNSKNIKYKKNYGKKNIEHTGLVYKDDITLWKEKYGMRNTITNNYRHLLRGSDISIIGVIEKCEDEGMSNKLIAWELDQLAFLTVNETKWSDESVRRIRNMMQGKNEDRDHFVSFMKAWRH